MNLFYSHHPHPLWTSWSPVFWNSPFATESRTCLYFIWTLFPVVSSNAPAPRILLVLRQQSHLEVQPCTDTTQIILLPAYTELNDLVLIWMEVNLWSFGPVPWVLQGCWTFWAPSLMLNFHLGSAAPSLSSKPQFLLQRAQTAQQGAELPAFFFSPLKSPCTLIKPQAQLQGTRRN